MKIYLILTPWFKRYYGEKRSIEIEIEEETNLESLILKEGIPFDEISFIQVNDTIKDKNYILKDEDSLKLFPSIIGG